MKKYLVVALALAVALSLGAPAMAKDGLSAGFGIGFKGNPNNLADTALKDGLEQAGTNDDVIIPENALKVYEDKGMLKNLEDNGVMTAIDFGINARYDFLGYLFTRLGFNYNKCLIGGETSWDWDAAGLNAVGVPLIVAQDAASEQMSITWDYAAWAIPVTVGLNFPILEGKMNIYAGIGIVYASGYFSAEVAGPRSGWVTQTGDVSSAFGGAITAPIDDKFKFEYSGIGLNYLVGFDAEVYENIYVFIETETQAVVGMSDAEVTKDANTATILGTDTIAYPVIPGGTVLRFGAKYFIGTPWM